MRTFRYHRLFAPEGRIFDTTGRTAPVPPSAGDGWTEHFGEQGLTAAEYADKVIERVVKAELASQGQHRKELEQEHEKKYGITPHALATNEEVANVMDNKSADGTLRLKIPGMRKRDK